MVPCGEAEMFSLQRILRESSANKPSLTYLSNHKNFSSSPLPIIYLLLLLCTYMKRTIPVLAMAQESPKMPLPIMALLRLNEDIPKEILPLCCWVQEQKMAIHLHFTKHDWLIILIAGFPLDPQRWSFFKVPKPRGTSHHKESLYPKDSCAGSVCLFPVFHCLSQEEAYIPDRRLR